MNKAIWLDVLKVRYGDLRKLIMVGICEGTNKFCSS